MPTRRGFLGAALAAAATPALSWADAGAPDYLAAARVADGSYSLFGVSAAGADVFRVPLPGRGHAAAAHPDRPEAVAFARRPGVYAIVLDCARGVARARLTAPTGRHFYGHGCFSEDGAVLFTTENDFEAGRGVIGLWAADDGYRRIGEVSSGGVGPHDVLRPPGGDALVVANGGVLTHPDTGRAKLNLPTMRPNLAYLGADLRVEERIELDRPLRRNSIRHLAARADGLIAFAMQWEGASDRTPPLLGLHRRGAPPRLLRAPTDAQQRGLDGYAGGVAFSGDGASVGITSPRGGRAHVFQLDGALAHDAHRTDVCGVAPHAAGLLTTDGLGGLATLDADGLRDLGERSDRAWDNHLVALRML